MPHIGNSYRCRTLCKRLALIRETWKPRNDTRYHYFLYHQILKQTCAREMATLTPADDTNSEDPPRTPLC